MTSSSTICGSGWGAGAATRSVRRITRPNELRTTSAPCSCAMPRDRERDRRVVEHSGDEDALALRARRPPPSAVIDDGLDARVRFTAACSSGGDSAVLPLGAEAARARRRGRAGCRTRRSRRRRTRARPRRTGSGTAPRTRARARAARRRAPSGSSIACELAAVQDLHGRGRAHHRDLRGRPRDALVVAEARSSPSRCTRRRRPCAAPRTAAARSPRRRRGASCAPWRMIPRHSRSLPGRYPLRVDEGDDRDVEAVAPLHEARRLLRGVDVEGAGLVIGWLATTPTVRPPRRPSPVTMFGAYPARSSRNVCSSSTSSITVRTSYDAVARAGTAAAARAAVAVDGVVRSLERRILEVVRREVARAARRRRASRRPRRSTTSVATPLSRSCTAAPPRRSRSIGTPVNSTTTSGPVTYANASLVMITWSAMPSSSAGPDTAGPTSISTIGTTPDASASALADAAPRVQRRDAFADVGARLRDAADDRDAELDREVHGPLDRSRPRRCRSRRGACRRRCVNQPTRRPSISPDRGVDGVAAVPEDGRRATPDRSGTPCVIASRSRAGQPTGRRPARRCVALWPPNPNEFDSTGPRRRSVAGRRARRRGRCRRRSARGWRSAGRRRRAATAARCTLPPRPRRAIMWPVTPLVEVTGGACVAEHLADRLGLGGVVERRRRAVRVDVPDVARRRARRRRARAACTRRRPRRRETGAVMWYASALRP